MAVSNKDFLSQQDKLLTANDIAAQQLAAGPGQQVTVRGGAPSYGNQPIPQGQPSANNPVTNRLQGLSQGVVNFFTGDSPGGGASEFAGDYARNAQGAAQTAATGILDAQDATRKYANDNAIGTPSTNFNTPMNYIRSVDAQGNTINREGYTNQAVDSSNTKRLAALAGGVNTAPTSALLDIMFPGKKGGGSGGVPLVGGVDNGRPGDPLATGGVRGAGIVAPPQENSLEKLMGMADKLRVQAGNSNNLAERANLIGRARGIEGFANPVVASELGQLRSATDTTLEGQRAAADAEYKGALGLEAQMRAARIANPAQSFDEDYYNALATGGNQELADNYLRRYYPGQETKSYASGGIVSNSLSGGGAGVPQMAEIQQYQQYADGARAMGLTTVPFGKFLSMRQGAGSIAQAGGGQGVMGFADGGSVPDVGGKMVVDTDPNAPTDSVPAMIDGEQPAALNSGEFVIPTDVVLFYGTDKLNKMIEKAREPKNGTTTGQSTGAPAGISAIAAASGNAG